MYTAEINVYSTKFQSGPGPLRLFSKWSWPTSHEISRHTPIIIVPGFSLFNCRVAKQSKALGEEWNYWAFLPEFRQPDFGAK